MRKYIFRLLLLPVLLCTMKSSAMQDDTKNDTVTYKPSNDCILEPDDRIEASTHSRFLCLTTRSGLLKCYRHITVSKNLTTGKFLIRKHDFGATSRITCSCYHITAVNETTCPSCANTVERLKKLIAEKEKSIR